MQREEKMRWEAYENREAENEKPIHHCVWVAWSSIYHSPHAS